MQFKREINSLLIGALLSFAIIAAAAAFWSIVGPVTLLGREDNPRLVEAEASIRRGSIYDRNNNLLVNSQLNDDAVLVRSYLYDAMNSALGYFSLRYGVGGAEAAYNTILRGDDLPTAFESYFQQNILHQPQQGSDIQLTFDLNVQQRLATLMKDYQGAAVVLSVPDGAVLSLISLPNYDPNTLTQEWDTLIDAPGNPFFNRPLQGQYQPGGLMQTPLIAAALLSEMTLNQSFGDATAAVVVDDIVLKCAIEPPQSSLTLAAAYGYGCPAPFISLAEQLGEQQVNRVFDTFQLDQTITLNGFLSNKEDVLIEATPEITPAPTEAITFVEEALGQGRTTVNPLTMASVTAAIINNGNAPHPYVLHAVRPPETNSWQTTSHLQTSIPLMTALTARQLRNLMLDLPIESDSVNSTELMIGGHVALAYSGDAVQTWFIGFTTLEDGRGVVIALVLEDTEDAELAASIGISALETAHTTLRVIQ